MHKEKLKRALEKKTLSERRLNLDLLYELKYVTLLLLGLNFSNLRLPRKLYLRTHETLFAFTYGKSMTHGY